MPKFTVQLFIACALFLGVASTAAHAAPRAPGLEFPAADAIVDSPPLLGWKAVSGAKTYEVQVSADKAFGSILNKGRTRTLNLAASMGDSLADGTYYWRVRGIDGDEKAGRWSSVRAFDKSWTTPPQLVAPADDFGVSWPTIPLALRWTPVPHATKYLLTVATDPSLAQTVEDIGRVVETQGHVYAPPVSLGPGRYYWAVQPVSASGHKGTRSRVGTFVWDWPSTLTTSVVDRNPLPEIMDPELRWSQVLGAARYDVEVNTTPEFVPDSKVYSETVIGTAVSPRALLPENDHYYWRVRAVDSDGHSGTWGYGEFAKKFDAVTPTIKNLHMRDHAGDLGPLPVTSEPIAIWDPVPGAAEYLVNAVPYDGTVCDYGANRPPAFTAKTADNAMDIARYLTTPGLPWPGSAKTVTHTLGAGTWCLDVRAIDGAGNESDPTYLPALGQPAFVYAPYDYPVSACSDGLDNDSDGKEDDQDTDCVSAVDDDEATFCPDLAAISGDYLEPAAGANMVRTPIFAWEPDPQAMSYWILVAKDAQFSNLVDYARVDRPMYVPRINYEDEKEALHWAVLPAGTAGGGCTASQPGQDFGGGLTNRRSFNKKSAIPQLFGPDNGAVIGDQPVFHWSAVEGAKDYRLEVATDPLFRDIVDRVDTGSTSYATSTTYPVDRELYWRVRPRICATASALLGTACGSHLEMGWSSETDLRHFRRTLPTPVLSADNPLGGETIPVLSWEPVAGATSYDLHVDQADGTQKDFTVRSPRFTPIGFYGVGIWKWKVRANFPTLGSAKVSGPYTPSMDYLRRLAAPADLRVIKTASGRLAFSWPPDANASKYRLEIAKTDSFATRVESVTTANTNYAPKLDLPGYKLGGRLYWRLAIVDSGNNVGAYRSGTVTLPRTLGVLVRGFLRPRKRSKVVVTVTANGTGVRGATVRVSGAGLKGRKRTGRGGKVTFSLRPRSGGRVRFSATRKGYRDGTVSRIVLGS